VDAPSLEAKSFTCTTMQSLAARMTPILLQTPPRKDVQYHVKKTNRQQHDTQVRHPIGVFMYCIASNQTVH
jgi:uncharacterized protein YecE (DUF72 family)